MLFRTILLFAVSLVVASCAANPPAKLRVRSGQFVLTAGHRLLTSRQLVGAEFEAEDGLTFRIDSVTPARERPDVLLHVISYRNAATQGAWRPGCEPDAAGRRAGFPVEGRWDEHGRYASDRTAWFLACTSGAQAKCALWGYAPWGQGPAGRPLAPFYQACQHLVRAAYDGGARSWTRNGTWIDIADVAGIRRFIRANDPAFGFEAGWGPVGATCVARTRWPDLLSLAALRAATPKLSGPCDEARARRLGGLILTRTRIDPVPGAAKPADFTAEADAVTPHVRSVRLADGTKLILAT